MPRMNVTVIATVYNEAAAILRLLASLAAQTRRPDEVVFCDGGSTDGTPQIIEQYAAQHPQELPNLRVIAAPGANISRGRNLALAAAAGPLIAATDAGVRLEADWLQKLTAPWAQANGEPPLAAAGFFVPDAQGVFQGDRGADRAGDSPRRGRRSARRGGQGLAEVFHRRRRFAPARLAVDQQHVDRRLHRHGQIPRVVQR